MEGMASTQKFRKPIMASTSLIFLSLIFISIATSTGAATFRPHGLVIDVTKDSSSLQYVSHIYQRTPLQPLALTLDLGGQFLWVDCNHGYISSTYRPVRCGSALCKLARSAACGDCFAGPKPGCNNNTCGLTPDNTVAGLATSGELAQDVFSVRSTDGSSPGPLASVPSFLFTCSSTFQLKGLAGGASGMAGLGRTRISLPSQLSSALGFPPKFAVCLGSKGLDVFSDGNGVVIFGDGPYNLLPGVDASKSLAYTPLIRNPISTASAYFKGEPSSDYFIGVRSIVINNKTVPLNASLLQINRKTGHGGTKLSTVHPYTVMETSIYKAFTQAFVKALEKVPRVKAVAPFTVCYSPKSIGSTRVGPGVPAIDLVLQSAGVYWRIWGANSMVRVSESALCLGFVDGGADPQTAIVIGGHQMEDNLLQFDLSKSRLGFSSSLLFRRTTCANFNFTFNG